MSIAQNWKEIKTGSEFSIGIKEDGTLWSWGFNGNGQLGNPTAKNNETSPIQIGNDTNWKTIAAGGFHALAIKNDGTLWGWGLNNNKQVIDDELVSLNSPEQIGSDTDWEFVEACYVSSFAIKNDGTLWAWGYNGNGELGVNDCVEHSQPTQVGTAKWKAVSAGGLITMGIQENNTLWRWGTNYTYSDTSGYSSTIDSFPVQVGTDVDWNAVSVGFEFALALKEDGTLWACGDNTNKQLGYDTLFANDFFQTATEHNWKKIEVGSCFSYAINDNDNLYAWGNNLYGQLGLNLGNNVSVPTLVPDMGTNIKQIAAAKGMMVSGGSGLYGLSAFVLKEDNSFCCAGANYIGQLGIGMISTNKTTKFICNYPLAITDYTISSDEITIFPNPATSYFTVTNAQDAQIILYNVLGQIICKQYSPEEQIVIPTENIPQGVYFLRIEKGNKPITRKIQIGN